MCCHTDIYNIRHDCIGPIKHITGNENVKCIGFKGLIVIYSPSLIN